MPRFLEICVSLAGLVLLSPVFLAAAVLVRLDSRGPVFHRAARSGKNGVQFEMLKFRTMASGASGKGTPITTRNDSRITAAGSFLRRTKLDELPQLVNVFRGDMGFVGPRPEDPGIVKKYSKEQKRILRYRPGITSPASILFRAEEELIPPERWEKVYLNDILPRKLETDLRYMEGATIWSDLKVIMKTVLNR
jgi:lipopolysaccharide/colanic/teichoic acid biosynthesis glycosyltransferase